MVLHNDCDPLPKSGKQEIEKTKKLFQTYSKIKPNLTYIHTKLAKAIFLLGGKFLLAKKSIVGVETRIKRVLLSFFEHVKYLLPHISMVIIAVIVVTSNLIVKYAKADYTISYPDPASEISFASNVDQFTPIIQNDAVGADRAYQNSSEAFVATNNSINTQITQREEPLPDNASSTVSYVVRNGDNLTALGWQFGVKLATLMYLNNIDNANLVKPGQTLKIPPKGYEVSASAIAKKEDDKQKKLASSKTNTALKNSSSSKNIQVRTAAGNSKNGYPYGYCTYYVATKRFVPSNWGNAKNWLSSAKRAGYSTGGQPAVGSIGVTPESWWGHVVYVESVNGDSVTFSEMNAVGWGRTSRRTLPVSSFRGFIY